MKYRLLTAGEHKEIGTKLKEIRKMWFEVQHLTLQAYPKKHRVTGDMNKALRYIDRTRMAMEDDFLRWNPDESAVGVYFGE